MALSRLSPCDVVLNELPFPIPRDLHDCELVSPDLYKTLGYVEQFIKCKEHRTAAALLTILLQRLVSDFDPQFLADLVCKRADCLLQLNYLEDVLQECEFARSMLNGKLDEHTAFLLLRAHELQGEIVEAFQYAVIYKHLDPKVTRDKGAFSRLRGKVIRLCGLGFKGHSNQHHIGRVIDSLMLSGDDHFSQESFALASCIYSEVLSNFEVVDAFEKRARCYLFLGNLQNAKEDCIKALDMTMRRSVPALEILTKIKTQLGEFKEALDLVKELQRLNPPNVEELYDREKDLSEKLREEQDSKKLRESQTMMDLSQVAHYSGSNTKPQKSTSKVPIRASKQSSGAKPKTKKELLREENRRAKECKQIAQEIEQKEMERERREKDKALRREKDNQRYATEVMGGSVVNKATTTDEAPSGSASLSLSKPRFPERTRKRKVRRKTRNLRAKREADDSDASSVCSINTSPADLFGGTDPQCRPRMPTFSDEEGIMSDVPKSSFNRNEQHKPHKPVDSIRRRPPGVFGPYQLCWQNKRKQGCDKGKTCLFAHSEKERKAWEEDRKKVTNKKTKTANASSTNNASSLLTEFRMAFRGPTECRAPLRIPQNGAKYKICPRWKKGTCKLNKACTFAHGDDELRAWNEHLEKMNEGRNGASETKITKPKNDERATISNSLPKEKPFKRPAPNYKLDELVSHVAGVTVTSEPKERTIQLQIPLNSEGSISHCWKIRVDYESQETGHLQDVILLPQHHKCFTLSSINIKGTATSHSGAPVEVELTNDLHYAVEPHLRSLNGNYQTEVVVTFSALVFGSFSQVLVLDFGRDSAHLSVGLNVEVGSQEFLEEYGNEKCKLSLDGTLWDDGSRNIVKFEPKQASTFSNDDLLDKYKLPKQEEMVPSPLLDKSQGLRPHNYKKVMHQLLFVEEVYIRKKIASFNVQQTSLQVTKLIVKREEVLCAQEGWLYGSFHVTRSITPDDAEGRLLMRTLGTVLIAKSDEGSVVYEALVDSVEDSRIIVKLSKRCCEELKLSNSSSLTVDIQFYINRLPLCEMHDSIDRLGPEHFRIVFPELGDENSERKIMRLRYLLDKRLNQDQLRIINKVAAPAIDAPPLVVFGPFGTGKTHTLNQAIRRIVVDQNNRVLICTHSNSAADLHVLLLDDYLKEPHSIEACKPLRIYTPLRKLSTVSDTVKKYCLIADDGTPKQAFKLPTREDVIGHRVVISTLGMSRALFDKQLHRGFFSHILIDEAAQALETDTLTPLTLAGNRTKVVFTGDHMQMSPDVFSPQAKKWGFQISLPERLFHDYKRRQSGQDRDPNLIFLSENYRSNERLLKFSSDMFYFGELSSGSSQPIHPQLGPLVFYAALGKEEIEENHASYRNLAEVNEVVKRVKELSDSWPCNEWGKRDLKQIAVVSSYRYQVKTIRDGLRKVGLGDVDVETIENVQGKQFRALFVSTVRTYHTYKELQTSETCETDRPYLYFLSDPKLLNTALTRAQSLIAVVGDPFSLRTIGDCQGVWEEFIKRCIDEGKLFGIEHNELEQCISQCGLNVNAVEFVPTAVEHNNRPSWSTPTFQEEEKNGELVGHCFPLFAGSDPTNESNVTEDKDASDSDDAGDEMSESDDLAGADDFAEYENVDETVPPKHMDPIMQALKEKREEEKLKRERKAKTRSEKGAMAGAQNLKREENDFTTLEENTSTGSKVVHEDIKMKTKKGKTQIILTNFSYKLSERSERLIRPRKETNQEHLEKEYIQRLLKNEPHLYRKCTLRLRSDRAQTWYGELRDAESEDILIEGNTRLTFDRDEVVVKLSKQPAKDCRDVETTEGRLRGTIEGVLQHVTNFRERQFVCTVSRDDPRVMYPINKSMRPIANLTDENCDGVQVYKKVNSDSDENKKAVRVRTIPRREALSGKFFFVVQYLQWRPEFPRPLGIVTKVIRRGEDISDSYNVLAAEYNLKEEFPYGVNREVDRNIDSWKKIPYSERESRKVVENAFTIDPPNSRALDDALTIESVEIDCFKVGVHIADVSYYVRDDSRIDDEARKRGTSYFGGKYHGDREVLMLPPTLSYDICSLLPTEERLAVSVYLVMDEDGVVQHSHLDFCRSVVKSQCRLTYAQAQRVILEKPVRLDPKDGELTPVVEESIRKLHLVAQARRKLRLGDASFFHFNHADRNEDIEAHELVEEMMILANSAVGKHLVQERPELLPLRIQRPPKTSKLNEWRNEFKKIAQLSLSLREHLNVHGNVEIEEQFAIPTSTWYSIDKARRNQDQRELKLLICNETLFPQLAVAHSSLNSRKRKAEDVIAAEVMPDERLHWSLNVNEYTRFTSPIRRYFDIVAHRLLLETSGGDIVAADIANVYQRCSYVSEQSSKFEKDCARVGVAGKLARGSCEFPAVVEKIGQDNYFIRLQLLSDTGQYLTEKQRTIRISHLGPIEQPIWKEASGCLGLKWKLRIYDASKENVERAKRSKDATRHLLEDRNKIQALFSDIDTTTGHHLLSELWRGVLGAIKTSDDRELETRLEEVNVEIVRQDKCRQDEESSWLKHERKAELDQRFYQAVVQEERDNSDEEDKDDTEDDFDDEDDFQDKDIVKLEQEDQQNKERGQLDANQEEDAKVHFVETSLHLKVADTVNVHLAANNSSGLASPEIELFNLAPGIDICIEHRKLPDRCFSITATQKATQRNYKSIGLYVDLWKPVLQVEAATVAVRGDDTIILKDLEVEWKSAGRKTVGIFHLCKQFTETRRIEIYRWDYACVRVNCFNASSTNLSSENEDDNEKTCSGTKAKGKDGENDAQRQRRSYWVGHCTITEANSSRDPIRYTLTLFQTSMAVPKELKSDEGYTRTCTVEIIKQAIPSRRMISTLMKLPEMKVPGEPEPLAHKICLGKAVGLPDREIALPSDELSIANHVEDCDMKELNDYQVAAVKASLRRRFTLILGPPGTGKTVTGVHIAYWFTQINHKVFFRNAEPPDTPEDNVPAKAPPQVLYCGPSNKSVDVVAEYLMRIPGLKILRIYGNLIEEEEFPIPNQVKQTRKTSLYDVPENLKNVALHHVIRDPSKSPYAPQLHTWKEKFERLKTQRKKIKDKHVRQYRKLIHKAENWVIRSIREGQYHQIILCTCSAAGSERVVTESNNIRQCIVDESGMCMEPETMVPIACSKAEQVVLIGDHKQLQPIVSNKVARSFGLNISLFERYAKIAHIMLEEQYRMHEDICEFPSEQFYENKLKTANSVKEREMNGQGVRQDFINFWPKHTAREYVPLAFCNVVGQEEELVVTSDEGNERSKSNKEEKEKVLQVIIKLLSCDVKEDEIIVLTPYRAQCHLISEGLESQGLSHISVMSIVKSQGSESDFVIISLVRSLPDSEIDHEPNGSWLRDKLGFVTDEHQMNVALTRAKRGLCIIGNKNLLAVCDMWSDLLEHYQKKSCLVDGNQWPTS